MILTFKSATMSLANAKSKSGNCALSAIWRNSILIIQTAADLSSPFLEPTTKNWNHALRMIQLMTLIMCKSAKFDCPAASITKSLNFWSADACCKRNYPRLTLEMLKKYPLRMPKHWTIVQCIVVIILCLLQRTMMPIRMKMRTQMRPPSFRSGRWAAATKNCAINAMRSVLLGLEIW